MRYSCMRVAVAGHLAVSILLSGCAQTQPIQTGLFGTAQHTGTLTILRVDDSWPTKDTRERRFVPLRDKMHIDGLDGPKNVVTKDDWVMVTLKSAFIKYFREAGGDDRKGEVAVILSFSSGTELREDLLIYSSQGQTMGSFLSFDDWPIIGPIQIKGDSLRLRILLLELDRAENEAIRNVVKFISQFGSSLAPAATSVFAIGEKIADFVISNNGDDMIFDQRFSLQRVDPAEDARPTRNPLLYGRYVLVLQEDALANKEVRDILPDALNPVSLTDMRYDLHSDRLYKVYNYRNTAERIADEDLDMTFDAGPIDFAEYYPYVSDDDNSSLTGLDRINSDTALEIRQFTLGFKNPKLNDFFRLYNDLSGVFLEALREGCRSRAAVKRISGEPEFLHAEFDRYCPAAKTQKGSLRFPYRTTLYPNAYTLLAQYPIHTHLVLSVDRSMGGGERVDKDFKNFNSFLEENAAAVKNDSKLTKISELVSEVQGQADSVKVLLSEIAQIEGEGEGDKSKACTIWKRWFLNKDAGEGSYFDTTILNELFHLTGRVFATKSDVQAFVTAKLDNCPG